MTSDARDRSASCEPSPRCAMCAGFAVAMRAMEVVHDVFGA